MGMCVISDWWHQQAAWDLIITRFERTKTTKHFIVVHGGIEDMTSADSCAKLHKQNIDEDTDEGIGLKPTRNHTSWLSANNSHLIMQEEWNLIYWRKYFRKLLQDF